MSEVSIKQFSENLKISAEKLISQLDASGVKGKKASDSISDDEKQSLLSYLKGLHGETAEAPKKITLNRKKIKKLNLSSGSNKRTVTVEVRKQRTYIKKSEEVQVEESVLVVVKEEVVAPVVEARPEVKVKDENVPITDAKPKVNAPTPKENVATPVAAPKADKKEAPKRNANKDVARNEKKALGDKKEGRAQKGKPAARRKGSKKQIVFGGDRSYGRRRKGQQHKKEEDNEHGFQKPVEKQVREIAVSETIKVSEIADQMAVKAAEVIKLLMQMGTMATINQLLDQETATLVIEEMGHRVKIVNDNALEESVVNQEYTGEYTQRSPVVTIMGHVDHGKTSLLDYIRSSKVASGEAGGITQHIGAYNVVTEGGGITFIDTPGHEAFTAMRARGAKVTDIVVVVVAADDGVMPQTREAIQHAKAAGVGMVVAINKMDKEGASPDRVMQELVAEEVVPEEWGGDVQFVKVSAKTGEGIEDLLGAILLQSEMLELAAPIEGHSKGIVIESRLDKGRGAVATILVQSGTLRKGDIALCGMEYGRIKAMKDASGNLVDSAGPSIPIEILGLSAVPIAGDDMITVESERKARDVASRRSIRSKEIKIARQQKAKLDNMFNKMTEGDIQDVNIILKADVQGSIQAISDALIKLSNKEVRVNIVSSGVGGISETDANLALASEALIFGFNVRADAKAKRLIDNEGIFLKYYSIIYEVVDEVKRAVEGKLAPDFKEIIIGIADVRDVFKAPNIGLIAGCMVTEGIVKRNSPIRVLRENVVIYEGALESLRRFKDDVQEVRQSTECGIGVKDYSDVQVGDQIEVFERIEVKRTLD